MKIYKYRHRTSASKGTWEYVIIPEWQTAKEFFEDLNNDWSWSEHHRGFDYQRCYKPPKEWVELRISIDKAWIKYYNKELKELKTLLLKLKPV